MSVSHEVVEIVARHAAQAVAEQGGAVPEAIGRETALFGEAGLLDSVGLVSLLLAVEEEISGRYGVAVALADEKALSQKNSPFRTIGTLVDYASQEIEAKRAGR
jgi:acyl carrier protein